MTLIEIAGASLAGLLLLAVVAWVYSLFAKTPILIVRCWGIGLAFLNISYWVLVTSPMGSINAGSLLAPAWHTWTLLLLATLWGIYHTRTSWQAPLTPFMNLSRDILRGRPLWSLWRHYLAQAFALFFVSAPFFVMQTHARGAASESLELFDVLGLAILLMGFLLARGFRPKVALFKNISPYGLEMLLWVGFYVLALRIPSGFLTLFSPLLMSNHLKHLERPA